MNAIFNCHITGRVALCLRFLFPFVLCFLSACAAFDGVKKSETEASYIPKSGARSAMVEKSPFRKDGIVRLSKIEVYSQYLDEYFRFVTEVGEVSLKTEPGVLCMYALSDKSNPCRVTVLEIYSSSEAYEAHIASAHFRRYKEGTLHMVKNLVLADQLPLNSSNKIWNFIED